ncbi:MAG: MBL fold metallo-hydrolase, partial [Gammaproteobacteria bacterium]|nr:MBL fold metallo-hydrolase [Gammaproteobacteria bacterium]
ARSRVLVECGLFQGPPDVDALNERPFPFKPRAIDAVVLSHAHLDHSGLLPRLYREGFRGKIFATPQTLDLLDIMLKDAAHIQEKDTEWENRRRERSGDKLIAPLYTTPDAVETLTLGEPVVYGIKTRITPDIEICFRDAGHILGSAIVELWVEDGGRSRKVVFSGDLGNAAMPLLRDPEVVREADLLLLESTYGDRDHRPLPDTLKEFAEILAHAARDGGNVLIPAFAIGRTQEILYHLGEFHRDGTLPQSQVFLDSPMAIAATEIHQRHMQVFSREARNAIRENGGTTKSFLPSLRYLHTVEESMSLNRISGGAIIVAGSGMCSGGRIRHHLKWNLWRQAAHVVIVGFQAQGTLGRALVDGAPRVRLLGEDVAVRAHIHTLGGFSAHAGQHDLVTWAGHFQPRPKLFLVHGELDKMQTLQSRFESVHGWKAEIPDEAQTVRI